MPTTISLEDLTELKRLYTAAKAVVERAQWNGCHIGYPVEIRDFFHHIVDSVWCERTYDPSQTSALRESISTASLQEVRCLLTAYSRIERMSDGAWKTILEQDHLAPVLERAEALLK